MSVLIKGMEMPKAGETIIIAENVDGTIYGRLEHGDDWYPLIEVPTPHGRLVDATELLRDSGGIILETIDDHEEVEEMIKDAPTVIEAEE